MESITSTRVKTVMLGTNRAENAIIRSFQMLKGSSLTILPLFNPKILKVIHLEVEDYV
jgi:hypothetical protein